MKTTPCKYCGKPVIWGETKEGQKIPLDPYPPVYRVFIDSKDEAWVERCYSTLTHRPTAHVSHFATCEAAKKKTKTR